MTERRRERLRAELERDVKKEARRQIAEGGVEGLSLSAAARAVGVTPPALYRYFDGRKGLAFAVYEDATAECVAVVADAVAREDLQDLGACLYAATRAFFDYSIAHPAEFDLLMGSGYARLASSVEAFDPVFVHELGQLYVSLFTELVRTGFEYPQSDELASSLQLNLNAYRELMGATEDFPLGVVLTMITCWRQIYGLTCMAVYGHMATVFDDFIALFNHMLDDLLAMLGLKRAPGQG
ncbi:TetR family transcriptional regulator [Streptomyces sp. NPDC047024]|uniref:TetR family transcriptional regulator n=1 Tax=Streptomyces sp. NPDC047024 TaxID=3155476 RepID=UPI0033CF3825